MFSVLACVAVLWPALQWFYKLGFLTLLLSQIIWQLRQLLQVQQPSQRRGLRCSEKGWQLWDAQRGWQSVQLRADSIATPTLVLLRYRRADQWFYRTLLVAVDSLSADSFSGGGRIPSLPSHRLRTRCSGTSGSGNAALGG